jgi:hypothetical protein
MIKGESLIITAKNNVIPLIYGFIPIALIVTFVIEPNTFIMISQTVLGKLLAISLIILYTSYNLLYGVFIALSFIIYYQINYVEGFSLENENKKKCGCSGSL